MYAPGPLRRFCACLLAGVLAGAPLGACGRAVIRPQGHPLWAVQLNWTDHGAPWGRATFRRLRQEGIRHAELNLAWAQLEPSRGHFDWHTLDQTLAAANAAGVKLIPIFWQSVWGGNPPAWIPAHERTSSGQRSPVPAWWDPRARADYFTYVTRTIAHIDHRPGFGGAFLDYGWLDAMWGLPPGKGSALNGYAAADIARFHQWLPSRYGSLAHFNRSFRTHFSSFGAVPAAVPGQPLFSVYQTFRAWSVRETYGRLTALVRRETRAPLYYYWGGGFGNAGQFWNLPDTFFQLARTYHVTVVLDDADHTGLALLFGSLARAYGVPLFEEWTPRPSGLQPEIAQWLGHTGFGAPNEVGADFFLYQGGREFQIGFPVFRRWLAPLAARRGVYPLQPVAVYISYQAALRDPAALAGMNARLGNLWRQDPIAFTVVTDRELAAHVVSLAHFRAVYPLNGRGDPAIRAYAAHGGHVLAHGSSLARYAPAYIRFGPSLSTVEAVPTVERGRRTAWISLAGMGPLAYSGPATLDYAGLGLPAGTYHIVDAASGAPIAAGPVPGGLRFQLQLPRGGFRLLRLLPGAAPAAAGSGSGTAPASTVAAITAGAPGFGLSFTGTLRQAQLLQQPAVYPPRGDGGGGGRPSVTVRLGGSSPLAGVRGLRLDVTYLAEPGQGFRVLWAPRGSSTFTPGPAVTSPGTNAWMDARLPLPGLRLSAGARIRLLVRDPLEPLYIQRISLHRLS